MRAGATTSACRAEGYQGNWIPHQLRAADRGRRVLRRRHRRALPAADRRGHPHRALLRPRLRARAARVVEGRQTREQALARYDAFCEDRARPSAGCCACSASSAAHPHARHHRPRGRRHALLRLGLRALPRIAPPPEPITADGADAALAHDQVDADREQRDAESLPAVSGWRVTPNSRSGRSRPTRSAGRRRSRPSRRRRRGGRRRRSTS